MPATSASEASAVVGLSEGGDNLALDKPLAGGAFGSEQLLVVFGTVIAAVLAEESSLRQRVVAHAALEAACVEVFVLHPQHLARALLLAAFALCLSHDVSLLAGRQ